MGFFDKLKKGLSKTRENITNKIEKLIIGYADIDDDLLDELEDVHVLRLDTARGIDHEDANVAVLYGADGAHDAVELQIFRNFVLAADACSVNKIEVETEFGIAGINGVAGSAGNLSDNVAVLTDKSIDNATLTSIRTTSQHLIITLWQTATVFNHLREWS